MNIYNVSKQVFAYEKIETQFQKVCDCYKNKGDKKELYSAAESLSNNQNYKYLWTTDTLA